MTEETRLPFDLPAVQRKKVTADFEGGSISSDGGLVLLREAERWLGLAGTLAGCIREWRDPAQVDHTLPAMLRFRMFAIACGYEDADCDALRTDPLFKLPVGRAPVSGRDLCSQPTMSRLENAPSRIEVARMTAAQVDIFCRSFAAPPAAITLDIDDTCDPVHGQQRLSLFNAHYDIGILSRRHTDPRSRSLADPSCAEDRYGRAAAGTARSRPTRRRSNRLNSAGCRANAPGERFRSKASVAPLGLPNRLNHKPVKPLNFSWVRLLGG